MNDPMFDTPEEIRKERDHRNMSRSTIHFAKSDGVRYGSVSFNNSWGFAAFIWSALVAKYATEIAPMPAATGIGVFGDWERLWAWVGKEPKLPAFELNTLVSTYDRAYVRGKEDILRLAESYELFEKAHGKPNQVQHLSNMAKVLRREQLENGAEYVSFYPMSVSEDLWWVYGSKPKKLQDEEDEGHAFRFGNKADEKVVRPSRWRMAQVDGPPVDINEVSSGT